MGKAMIRKALISGGVVYHHELTRPGQLLADFEVIDLADLVNVDLNLYDLLLVPRSTDGDMLRARRYQFARFLDNGGVLLAFGELWANWFPGCHWQQECPEDVLEPVVVGDHPVIAGYSARDLHWHPSQERWCCHGHLVAPSKAEVLVQNKRGDAWLYVDRATTNGVVLASTNLDPDTHTYHGSAVARQFFEQLLTWAYAEAAAASRRQLPSKKIAGLYSGVYFQQAFYNDAEFGPRFAVLPVWELAATELLNYAALWIPRESNQNELMRNKEKILDYLNNGGIIVCFEQVNQPWLPLGSWTLHPANLQTVRVADHPIVSHLTPAQVGWHSHGVYNGYRHADILVDDGQGGVMLFLDEQSFPGKLLAGTMDPDCHVGFGTDVTRPLLRAILSWIDSIEYDERIATCASPFQAA
jgi:hypothetical protein